MAFGAKTNERPGVRSEVRYARVSAYKAREVLDLIRGESYGRAAEILEFSERGVATIIRKALDSAAANAENNNSIPAEELFVSACFADEGPTLKRFRPRARGRAMRIRKRTCHITVIVSRYSPEELTKLRARDAVAGRARTSSSAAEARRRRVERSRVLEAQRKTEEDAHDHEAPAGEAPYGEGSAVPLADGSAPEGFEIKGNADSMLYHVPGGRNYNATKAEVYFATVEDAERAGFSAPGSENADGDDGEEG